MESKTFRDILKEVEDGRLTAEEGYQKMKLSPFEDLGYAKIDHHRAIRQGTQEVIFGSHKTKEQIEGITNAMLAHSDTNILITRLCRESADYLQTKFDLEYHEDCHIGIVNRKQTETPHGQIVVATGGTSDISVAEEASLTAEVLGNHVSRLYDVGVSGVHRLLSNVELLENANVVIAVAGMEGALASVVGGLVDCPVIAVPTSVGYGANFGGLSALLSMLNSCASGISVVNIDNGFGAGYLASMINHMVK